MWAIFVIFLLFYNSLEAGGEKNKSSGYHQNTEPSPLIKI